MYLAPQNVPRATVLTPGNTVVLYCIQLRKGEGGGEREKGAGGWGGGGVTRTYGQLIISVRVGFQCVLFDHIYLFHETHFQTARFFNVSVIPDRSSVVNADGNPVRSTVQCSAS